MWLVLPFFEDQTFFRVLLGGSSLLNFPRKKHDGLVRSSWTNYKIGSLFGVVGGPSPGWSKLGSPPFISHGVKGHLEGWCFKCVGSLDSYDFMGGCGFCCSSHRCELCRKTHWIHSVSECTFVLLSWCGFWCEKTFSSGANIDQFAVCQLFVLAVNLDLACPLSFGKKDGLDLTNKSITGRTLVEKHWEKSSQPTPASGCIEFLAPLADGQTTIDILYAHCKIFMERIQVQQQGRQCVYSTGYTRTLLTCTPPHPNATPWKSQHLYGCENTCRQNHSLSWFLRINPKGAECMEYDCNVYLHKNGLWLMYTLICLRCLKKGKEL